MNVLVTGMGALSILGKDVSAHRQGLFDKVKSEPPYLSTPAQLAQTPPDLKMIPLEAEATKYQEILSLNLSRNSLLALAAFEECLAQSGWTLAELQNKRVAFIIGTTAGCSGTDTDYIEAFVRDQSPDPREFKRTLQQNPAFILKKFSKLQRASAYVINNACTSSTDAVGLGAKLVANDTYDVVFAGGADEILFQTFYGFSCLQLVSPQFKCAPFDKNRSGLLLTEGAALVCLERPEDFAQRAPGRQAQGSVLGYASITEVYHQTSPNPEAEGLQKITQSILAQAGLEKNQIDFVNAHATGTPANDRSEGSFFAQHLQNIPVTATKGYTGHCLGAVGALEAIFCLLCMQERKLPATLGFTTLDPDIGLSPVLDITSLDSAHALVAYSTSVGFGGVNSGLLLRGSVA